MVFVMCCLLQCCHCTATVLLQAPFSIMKSGPAKVSQNVLFNFDVLVVFLATAKGVKVVDDLPSGMSPAGTATWTPTASNGAPAGCESEQ